MQRRSKETSSYFYVRISIRRRCRHHVTDDAKLAESAYAREFTQERKALASKELLDAAALRSRSAGMGPAATLAAA